jgi:hypothetical protein
MITLSCLSVTPIVTAAPTCSFNPPTVMVATSGVVTSVMTITSYGAAATTTTTTLLNRNRRIFYALGLLVPGLALAGIGASRGRKRNVLGLLLLMAMASGLLLMPACNGTNLTSQTTSTLNGAETPKNNYTFTLTGADENGAAPSTTTPATVMVAVN